MTLWMPGHAPRKEQLALESLSLDLDDEERLATEFHLAFALYQQGRGAESDVAMQRTNALAARMRYSGCDVPVAWVRWLRAVDRLAPDADELARRAWRCTGGRPSWGSPSSWDSRQWWGRARAPVPADVVVDLGDLATLPHALAAITPYVDEVATYGTVVSGGSTAHFVGRGLVALGRLAEGRRHSNGRWWSTRRWARGDRPPRPAGCWTKRGSSPSAGLELSRVDAPAPEHIFDPPRR